MSSTKCYIEIFLNDACNKLTWTNNTGVPTKDNLLQIGLKLIVLRSRVNDNNNVCYHHNKFYMKKYTTQQKMWQSIWHSQENYKK